MVHPQILVVIPLTIYLIGKYQEKVIAQRGGLITLPFFYIIVFYKS